MSDADIFASVRAAIELRLAEIREHEARLAESREQCFSTPSDACVCSECRAMPTGASRPASMRKRLRTSYAARLPDDVRIPSPEPRLPNLNAPCLSFAARLLKTINERFDGNAPQVYTAAGLTRQAFSQIISDETHQVSKRTAVAFALALHCTPDEARLLLASAGYAFARWKTSDAVIESCLESNPPIWDLPTVNLLLREYRADFQL